MDLRQHALLARLDEVEVAEAELVGLDHAQDRAVGARSRLDAVKPAAQLLLESRDVAVAPKTLLGRAGRGREADHGPLEVDPDHVDPSLGHEGGLDRLLERHPVPQEHVNRAARQRLKGDRDRQDQDLGLVPDRPQDEVRHGRGRRDVRPADVREHGLATGLRVLRGRHRRRKQGREREQACGAKVHGGSWVSD